MTPEERDPRPRTRVACFLGLIAFVAIAYAPAFGADFVDLDDVQNLVENPYWRGFSLENLTWAWTTPHMGHYHPLTWMSFALDHALWGGDPRAMHAFNVALHAATACWLVPTVERIVRAVRPQSTSRARLYLALIAAALWAVHPLRVESVAWLTERRDVLSGLFLVAALHRWLVYVQEGRRRRDYALALLLLVVSLLAKAWGITFFVVLIAIDRFVLRRDLAPERATWRVWILDKVPFALAGTAAGIAALWAQASLPGTLRTLEEHGLAARVAQAAYGTWFYVVKTFVPTNLRPMIVPAEDIDPASFLHVLALVAAAGVTLAAGFVARRRPALASVWFVYLIVLAPVSGLSQAGFQLVADRYSYLATIPFAVAASCAAVAYFARARVVVVTLVATVLVAACVATNVRTRAWHDTESLWTSVLRLDPADTYAGANLARLCERRSDVASTTTEKRQLVEMGIAYARRARVHPHHPQLLANWGVLLERLAKLDAPNRDLHLRDALARHDRALELARRSGAEDPQWYLNRAAVLVQLGRVRDALPDLERNLELRPDHVYGLRSMALAWNLLDQPNEALPYLRRALELAPDDAGLHLRLARTFVVLERADDARRAYRAALERNGADRALTPPELEEARAGAQGSFAPK